MQTPLLLLLLLQLVLLFLFMFSSSSLLLLMFSQGYWLRDLSRWGWSFSKSDNWTGFNRKSSAPPSKHLLIIIDPTKSRKKGTHKVIYSSTKKYITRKNGRWCHGKKNKEKRNLTCWFWRVHSLMTWQQLEHLSMKIPISIDVHVDQTLGYFHKEDKPWLIVNCDLISFKFPSVEGPHWDSNPVNQMATNTLNIEGIKAYDMYTATCIYGSLLSSDCRSGMGLTRKEKERRGGGGC